MYRELVVWSALLLTLVILYRRNAKGNAVSLLTLSVMVLYLIDIYAFEPQVSHLSFYSSLASAAFLYVVVRQVPIGNIISTVLMALSLVVDYLRATGLASQALLLIFVVAVTFSVIVLAMINLDKLGRRTFIAMSGLILFLLSDVVGAIFLKKLSLGTSILNALALNVTPLLLLAER